MKRLALIAFGLSFSLVALVVAGCSQSTAHPAPLGDCKVAGCNPDLGLPVLQGDPRPAIGGDGGGDGGDGSTDAGGDATPIADAGPG